MKGIPLKGRSGGGPAKAVAPPAASSYGGYGSHPTSYGNNSRTEQLVRTFIKR